MEDELIDGSSTLLK